MPGVCFLPQLHVVGLPFLGFMPGVRFPQLHVVGLPFLGFIPGVTVSRRFIRWVITLKLQ
jgi:hypothetical protein